VNLNKTQIVTLRVPIELKVRLEREAKHQGVSLNNLANYYLTTQLSQIEVLSVIESRISQKNITELKLKKYLAQFQKEKRCQSGMLSSKQAANKAHRASIRSIRGRTPLKNMPSQANKFFWSSWITVGEQTQQGDAIRKHIKS